MGNKGLRRHSIAKILIIQGWAQEARNFGAKRRLLAVLGVKTGLLLVGGGRF